MSNLVHLSDLRQRPRAFAAFERHRHSSAHWFVELFAEAFGVFLYVFAGVGSQAIYVLGNILKLENAGSVLQIGLAYAFGILFALGLCGATSGGHFNPAITITNMLFHGFPPLKGARYIAAQLFGGYVACLIIYVQYKGFIIDAQLVLMGEGPGVYEAQRWTPNGPGGIFALSLAPGADLGRAFVNEFVCDFVIGMVIFACLDPTNTLIPPVVGPVIIALAYAVAIWSYSANGLSANAARDLGGRLAALTIWGKGASGGAYAAIAALTNIPATLLAYVTYEFMLADSDRVVTSAHLEMINAHKNHRHLRDDSERTHGTPESDSLEGKGRVHEHEHV
ncbi:putative aquaporin 2 [Mycena pura]|uniref:Aquaporin 2 n=1 Tax=Mycena pura TaxID=153505 RepID=A0AAD6Y9R7_9AGAR|nr:putative aquaporin 2 [Mycena pura]